MEIIYTSIEYPALDGEVFLVQFSNHTLCVSFAGPSF